jgi:hypothetical protein
MAEPVRARQLTDQEGQRLQQIVRRGKHGSARVRRAMIIMASASGTLVPAIARLAAADEDTVRDVIHLFNAKGLAALDLCVPARTAPLRAQPLSGSHSPPSPRMAGGPRPCGSATPGSWPWPVPCP